MFDDAFKRTWYLFLTVAVVCPLVRLEEAYLSVVLGYLDQTHCRPHCGITGVDKHHHLRHTQTEDKEEHNIDTYSHRSSAGYAVCPICKIGISSQQVEHLMDQM